MSAAATKATTGRQTKLTDKTRYALMLDDDIYDWLDAESRRRGLSMAAIISEILRRAKRGVPHGITAP